MKKLERLSLVQLSREELKNREMDLLKGGTPTFDCCGCGSSSANKNANSAAGYGHSSTGSETCYHWIYTDGWEGNYGSHC